MTTADHPADHTLVDLDHTELVLADPDEDLRGLSVADRHGDDLGKVDGLLVDETEIRVRFLQVGSGGFLGLGRKERLIPTATVVEVDVEVVTVDLDRAAVAASPTYDPDLERAPAVDYTAFYDYYGVPAFWAAGYVPPLLPGRARTPRRSEPPAPS